MATQAVRDLFTSPAPLFYCSQKDTISPRSWISTIEELALVHGWSDQFTLRAASFSLRDLASDWYNIEIQREQNMTWNQFKDLFLDFTGATNKMGWIIWTRLVKPRDGQPLNEYYLRVQLELQRWADTLPDPEIEPSRLGENLPDVAALDPVSKQLFVNDVVRHVRREDLKRMAMDIFYAGNSPQAQAFLDDKDCKSIREMRSMLALYEEMQRLPNHPMKDDDVKKKGPSCKNPDSGNQGKKSRNVTCYYCNKAGHGQQECRKRARDKAPMVEPPSKINDSNDEEVNDRTVILTNYAVDPETGKLVNIFDNLYCY
jgi:hypothetical protein